MPPQRQDPADLLPLTPAAFYIAMSLTVRARHGYAIMQDVAELSRGAMNIGPGTLYRSLQRMQVDGLIEELVDYSDGDADDDRRRYYRLSAMGKRVAAAEARRLDALVEAASSRGLLRGRIDSARRAK
jgi:DNA-binding PadR family transcriptional regulator